MSERLLREVFEDHSATPPASMPQTVRLTDVHRRIARTRRRRTLAATATVAAAILAIAGGAVALRGPSALPMPPTATTEPSPSPTAKTFAGIPEYVEGARVFAAASGELPTTSVKLRFTPTSKRLAIIVRCSVPGIGAGIELPNSAGILGVACGADVVLDNVKYHGMKVGEPVTLTLKVGPTSERTETTIRQLPLPESGTFSLGVGLPVAFEDFPLPPRPDTLPALPGARPNTKAKVVKIVRNDPADPRAPVTVTIPWAANLNFDVHQQTPGTVHVSLDGKEFMACEKWDYAPRSAQLTEKDFSDGCGEERVLGDTDKPGRPGDTLTVRVRPEHVTGDWEVIILDFGNP
ncbi:hypothetical protein GCM10009682_41080 [Luedemannella flava]|uniref:Uncharacterized protein n=1 Tax=Luedemannella flava TaxID=349316 RepID=A0ABP4YG73_9ACTN